MSEHAAPAGDRNEIVAYALIRNDGVIERVVVAANRQQLVNQAWAWNDAKLRTAPYCVVPLTLAGSLSSGETPAEPTPAREEDGSGLITALRDASANDDADGPVTVEMFPSEGRALLARLQVAAPPATEPGDAPSEDVLDAFVEYMIAPQKPGEIGSPVYLAEWLRDNLVAFRASRAGGTDNG